MEIIKGGNIVGDGINETDGNFEKLQEEKRGRGRPPKSGGVVNIKNATKNENINLNNKINLNEQTWEFDDVIAQWRYGNIARYIVNLDLLTLGEMYGENGLIYYYSHIQRGSKLDRNNKEIPIYRTSKVKQIRDAIISDQWHGGCIILNANITKDKIEYDEENKILKGKGRFYIIDGNHRLITARLLTKLYRKGQIIENPGDYQLTCIIDVTDDIGAAKIFSEHSDTPLRIPKSRSEFLQVDKLENIVARKIMRDSQFRNRVETVGNQVKGNNVVSFNILIKGIQYLKPKTKEQAEVLSIELIKYINTIINIYPEILGIVDKQTREENRKILLAAEPMFIEAYLAAYNDMIGKDDVVERLKSLRKTIRIGNWQGEVLARENKVWLDNITINGKIVNKRSTTKFVTDTIREYLKTGTLPVEYEIVK